MKNLIWLLVGCIIAYCFHDWLSWKVYGGSRILRMVIHAEGKPFGTIYEFLLHYIYRDGWYWTRDLKLWRYV